MQTLASTNFTPHINKLDPLLNKKIFLPKDMVWTKSSKSFQNSCSDCLILLASNAYALMSLEALVPLQTVELWYYLLAFLHPHHSSDTYLLYIMSTPFRDFVLSVYHILTLKLSSSFTFSPTHLVPNHVVYYFHWFTCMCAKIPSLKMNHTLAN